MCACILHSTSPSWMRLLLLISGWPREQQYYSVFFMTEWKNTEPLSTRTIAIRFSHNLHKRLANWSTDVLILFALTVRHNSTGYYGKSFITNPSPYPFLTFNHCRRLEWSYSNRLILTRSSVIICIAEPMMGNHNLG